MAPWNLIAEFVLLALVSTGSGQWLNIPADVAGIVEILNVTRCAATESISRPLNAFEA